MPRDSMGAEIDRNGKRAATLRAGNQRRSMPVVCKRGRVLGARLFKQENNGMGGVNYRRPKGRQLRASLIEVGFDCL